ncbi:hypothetical protein Pla52o_47330 [Novipirellula galeiformis]|uniref:Uncharacterized protein n=1 Tax=Novipirellula galeiformis TaxID=2528004 RepID=A0A5C6C7T9_9BACT|nr:hypothetical protein Pla52o_47330 [Novipirellula galeiformis]
MFPARSRWLRLPEFHGLQFSGTDIGIGLTLQNRMGMPGKGGARTTLNAYPSMTSGHSGGKRQQPLRHPLRSDAAESCCGKPRDNGLHLLAHLASGASRCSPP